MNLPLTEIEFSAATAAQITDGQLAAAELSWIQGHPEYATLYYRVLSLWRETAQMASRMKALEMKTRLMLAKLTFVNPEEGTHHHVFGEGKSAAKLTLTQPYNRKIDETQLTDALNALRESVGAVADEVVQFKPEVKVGPYKKLTAEQQLLLAPAITTTPGTPAIKYIPEKDT